MQTRAAVIVGCGIMGRDIAAIFLAAGWTIQIVERHEAKWAGARRLIEQSTRQIGSFESERLVLRKQLSDIAWTDVALALEVVSEDLSLKRAIFAELDALAPPSVVLGSNSSSMRITDIAEGCSGARRMANTHFFQPAHLVPLVEIAKGENTSDATVDALHAIFSSVGRMPVRVNRDVPGFLANRIQHALMREAFSVIDEGLATAEDVDIAVRFGFGFRYAAAGPMLLKEFAGFDTQHAAATVIYPSLCNDSAPSRTLTDLVASGRLGMKARRGFREWSDLSMAEERQRYEAALMQAARILADGQARAGERS